MYEFVCEVCGKTTTRDITPKQLLTQKPRFCSRRCQGLGYRGPGSAKWTGGRQYINGYVRVYAPNHPNCDQRGFVLEHRLVLERVLGRYLKPNEVVHHKNGVRDDNRPENLGLMGFEEHSAMHWADALQGIWTKKRWGNGFDCCQKCGTTSRKHQARGLCKPCYDEVLVEGGEWSKYPRKRPLEGKKRSGSWRGKR